MNPLKTIVPEVGAPGTGQASVTDAEEGFRTVLSARRRGPSTAAPPEISGPATLSRDALAAHADAPTLPDDDDDTFLVVEDVSTGVTDGGEAVAVVSGEAVEGVDEALAVAEERGSGVVIALSQADYTAQKLGGGVFASMLIDQRNGVLPNPFSLMRLPERPVPDEADADEGTTVAVVPDLFDETDIEPVSGGGVGIVIGRELGREMSRVEAPAPAPEQGGNRLLSALRARIGALPFFGGPSSP